MILVSPPNGKTVLSLSRGALGRKAGPIDLRVHCREDVEYFE